MVLCLYKQLKLIGTLSHQQEYLPIYGSLKFGIMCFEQIINVKLYFAS